MHGLLGIEVLYDYLVRALAVLLVIPFHEAAHAFVSWRLGDPTAKNAGRLSLNPLRHFDPLGTLCMVLGGVGWAKPVGIDPRRLGQAGGHRSPALPQPQGGHGGVGGGRTGVQFSAGLPLYHYI